MVWLIVDEFGVIVAIVGDTANANAVANALAAHVERSTSSEWHVGDTLPIFHE